MLHIATRPTVRTIGCACPRSFREVDEREVEEFISSSEWVDMFAHVKRSFAGPFGLGLKVVAPEAGVLPGQKKTSTVKNP